MSSTPPSSSAWEPPLPEDLQRLLPQYEITGILGRGGMGAVYKGRQTKLNRTVAIKVLPETFTRGEDKLNFARRFEQEAQAMANLDHPAIVSVYDFGETAEGQLFFVMEFIDGMDIHKYLWEHGGKLSQESALTITAFVLDALEYAHNRGIIHRDIKPANILLNNEGRVKIADFGLAKKFGPDADENFPALTMSNVSLGTLDFTAPEALEGGQVPDHRADLYAVGVMLYQMLTGKLPRGQFKAPSVLHAGIDPRLDEIVAKAMQPYPDDRYESAAAIRADLDVIFSQPFNTAEAGGASGAVKAVVRGTSWVKERRTVKRKKTANESKLSAFLVVSAAAVAIVGVVVFATRGAKRESSLGVEPMNSEAERGEPERRVEPERNPIAETPAESPAEDVSRIPMPLAVIPVAKTDPVPESPPAEVRPAAAPRSPIPAESPLASVPGLQSRLEGYLSARRAKLEDLAGRYRRGLDSRLNQAADAGDLSLAKVFREEIDRVGGLQSGLAAPPEDSAAAVRKFIDLPDLAEESSETIVTLRAVWATEHGKIREELDGKLRQSLQTLEGELTRAREFERAETVMAYRESIGAVAVTMAGEAEPKRKPDPTVPATASPTMIAATKEAPFENSTGMKFVPVPATEVLFCIHETRWRDYAVYAESDEATIDSSWRNQTHDGFVIEDSPADHPVVLVSWEDAKSFCTWLSDKEGRTYRLPTDREWSSAVGMGREDSETADIFPWGEKWPLPAGAGNYRDTRSKKDGHVDGYPTTAPVMRFAANHLGLYDMGGNVWEWVEGASENEELRVLRGGSWYINAETYLRSSYQAYAHPSDPRNGNNGFRIVVEVGADG